MKKYVTNTEKSRIKWAIFIRYYHMFEDFEIISIFQNFNQLPTAIMHTLLFKISGTDSYIKTYCYIWSLP